MRLINANLSAKQRNACINELGKHILEECVREERDWIYFPFGFSFEKSKVTISFPPTALVSMIVSNSEHVIEVENHQIVKTSMLAEQSFKQVEN